MSGARNPPRQRAALRTSAARQAVLHVHLVDRRVPIETQG